MRTDVCGEGLKPANGRDPRITAVGRILRKTSVDELPQLFNVIRGEMAIVGPRPEQPFLVRRYEKWQHLRLLAEPEYRSLASDVPMRTIPLHEPEATHVDLEYIRTASIVTDGRIVMRTFGALLFAHGAHFRESLVILSIHPKHVCIVGTGYVGMASAIGFAELGHRVTGYDIVTERIRGLQVGIAPYREAGIEDALRRHVNHRSIAFHEDLETAVRNADYVVVAVGTPAHSNGAADLSAVEAALAALAPIVPEKAVIVLRSTVPPGTSERLAAMLANEVSTRPNFCGKVRRWSIFSTRIASSSARRRLKLRKCTGIRWPRSTGRC